MPKSPIPQTIGSVIPEKIDFTGRALTQSNLNKKLSQQRERQQAKQRTAVKVKVADKQLTERRRAFQNGSYKEEVLAAPIDINEVLKPKGVEPISVEVIKKVLPKGIGKHGAIAITDMINEAASGMDDVFGSHFRDNCISWAKATNNAVMSAEQYMNAVKFVTYKMAGDNNVVAYTKTFPDRVTRMAQDGMDNASLSSYANIYAKGKIVTEVHAMALVPTHLMYQDYFHLAVKTQVEIMTDPAVSAKVRSDAATSLMTHLKTPEIKKAELDITVRETDTIGELRDVLTQLSSKQAKDVMEGEYQVIDVSYQQIVSSEDESK